MVTAEVGEAPDRGRPLDRLMSAADDYWGLALAVAPVLAALAMVLARAILTVGLVPGGTGWAAVASALVAGLFLVTLAVGGLGLLRAFSRYGGERTQMGTTVSLIASFGLSVEAFAGASAWWWRHRGISVDAWGGLWQAEHFYWWQLANSIPFLGIPQALGWSEPAFAAAHTPPGLVLAFKLVVLVPLVRLAVSAYRAVLHRVRHESSEAEEAPSPRWYPLRSGTRIAQIGPFLMSLVAVLAAVGLTLLLSHTFDAGSQLNRWVLSLLDWILSTLAGVVDLEVDHPLAQRIVLAAVQVVALMAVVLLVLQAASALLEYLADEPGDTNPWASIAALGVGCLTVAYTAAIWLSGLTVFLISVGAGGSEPSLPDTRQFAPVAATFGWHIADALPGPDIPGTLGWTAPVQLTGPYAGWFLLAVKVLLSFSVVFLCVPYAYVRLFDVKCGAVIRFWISANDAATRIGKLLGKPDPQPRARWSPFSPSSSQLIHRVRHHAAELDRHKQLATIARHARRAADAFPPELTLSQLDPPERRPGQPLGRKKRARLAASFDEAALARSLAAIATTLVLEAPDCAGALPQLPPWLVAEARSEATAHTGPTSSGS